jgi:hypothetical protein
MRLLTKLWPTLQFLERRDIAVALVISQPVKERKLKRFEEKAEVCLPHDVSAFYLEGSDGLYCYWETASEYGSFQIPSLQDLRQRLISWGNLELSLDDSSFPYVDDEDLAKKTFARMAHWIPFSGAVVFHQHDWMDGGTGENGAKMANGLLDFIWGWATVCFQRPTSLYWPDVLMGDGVDWLSSAFNREFAV